MKKISICALALFATLALQAQNKKGNWLAGVYLGSSGFSFGNSESRYSGSTDISKSESNGFNIGIGPTLGYYISDNVVIGSYLGIGFSSYKNDYSNTGSSFTSTDKTSYMSLSVGPYGRFYFGNNNGKGMPFAEANAGITFYPGYDGTYTPSTGGGYTYKYNKYNSWNAGAKFGYEHFINTVIGIQYYIGYSHNSYKYETFYDYTTGIDYTYMGESSSNNITFGAGLQIHLDCKKKNKK